MLWSLNTREPLRYGVFMLHNGVFMLCSPQTSLSEVFTHYLSLSGVSTLMSFHSLESLLPWNCHSCESSLQSLHVKESSRYEHSCYGVF